MELAEIATWLKTSIPGIIILGALGSILAVLLAKILARPLKAIAYRPVAYFRKERLWRYWRSGSAYQCIVADSTNRKLIYYLFHHLARLLVALSGLITTIIIFSIIVSSKSEILLTYGTFILSTSGFLFAYWVRTEYDYIIINYIVEWRETGLVKNPFPDGLNKPTTKK